MHSHLFSSTLVGVEARLVTVESVVTSGLPGLTVVGLPDAAVSEAGARVRSALKLSGVTLPPRRMVVNLSPADLRKSGGGFDLALALGLLEAIEELPSGCLADTLVLGELSLHGQVRGVRGLVPSLALATEHPAVRRILLPREQAATLPPWEGVDIVPVESLAEAMEFCRNGVRPEPVSPARPEQAYPHAPDLRDVKGQALAKLALEVSAAGGHHLALMGPPGCGKSLLASCLPGLLPPLTEKEQREVAAIASVCRQEGGFTHRPFRAPGVSLSAVALLGGYHPGEVTRAHHGVLFLDEFLEFRKDTLESLRLVLEEGEVKVARARLQVAYPARFTLVCAMNPCPCGMSGVPGEECTCSHAQLNRYRSKLSGPLLDRFDLMVGLQRVSISEFAETTHQGESTAEVADRVRRAREIQLARGTLNSQLRTGKLFATLGWNDADRRLAHSLAERVRLSLRAFEKWLRVSRTLADLEGETSVERRHLLTARSIRWAEQNQLAA
ncbi:MAG: YifB family Mg chelatase-like AAA ATPase [Vulcanimicrobiota bacterium]